MLGDKIKREPAKEKELDKAEPTKAKEKKFFFPELGKTVKATSLAEALKKAKKSDNKLSNE